MTERVNLKEAVDFATRARRDAQARKREHGNPRNPFQARPGHEKEFEEAAQTARVFDTILKEIDKNAVRERMKALKSKAVRATDRALDTFIGVGLICLGALGIAAVCILARLPDPYIRITAIVGVGVALARTVITARK